MLKALYSPIYFTKPAAEPMDILRKRLAQYGPVRVGSDGAEWMTLLDGSEALVADMSESDTTVGAEVAYALHKCRIPVLCLRRRGTSAVRAMETSTHPLLTCHEYADDSSAESAIDAFLTPPASPGRIFVVEGGDGAGKQTQTALLRDRLTAMGYPVSTIDFPHDAAMHGTARPAMPARKDLLVGVTVSASRAHLVARST
jgi:dTMP kinase